MRAPLSASSAAREWKEERWREAAIQSQNTRGAEILIWKRYAMVDSVCFDAPISAEYE